jgi:DNA polymerase I-like protein with 3'-5' exonuclease and polymerase domains
MRLRGVRIDTNRAEQVCEELSKREQQMYVSLNVSLERRSRSGLTLLSRKAFKENNLWYPKTEKGMASFQAPWLEAHEHELPQTIVQIRKINKARTTFIEKMILGHTVNGRIHAEAHPLRSDGGGTVTGRV